MPNRQLLVSATRIFHHEINEAKRLGFELQVNMIDGQATARMQPRSTRAHAACERATGKTNQAIEASQPIPNPAVRLDCLREAIAAAMGMARQVIG